MDANFKELIYLELNGILQQLEDGDVNGATMYLEDLITRIKYDQL